MKLGSNLFLTQLSYSHGYRSSESEEKGHKKLRCRNFREMMSGLLIRQEKVGDEGRAFTSTHPPDLLLIPSSMLSQNTNGSHLSLCNVAYIIVLLATDLCDSKHLPSPSRPSTQTRNKFPRSAHHILQTTGLHIIQNNVNLKWAMF